MYASVISSLSPSSGVVVLLSPAPPTLVHDRSHPAPLSDPTSRHIGTTPGVGAALSSAPSPRSYDPLRIRRPALSLLVRVDATTASRPFRTAPNGLPDSTNFFFRRLFTPRLVSRPEQMSFLVVDPPWSRRPVADDSMPALVPGPS